MTQPSTRRERNKTAKQERIYAAAWELFTTQGYEQTTIRQIAERADVGLGTVMAHVGDKSALLRQLYRQAIAQRVSPPPPDPQQPLEERLYGQFNTFIEFYAQQPELTREFLRQALNPTTDQERQADADQVWQFLKSVRLQLLAAQQAGQLRPDAMPHIASKALFATYQFYLQSWLSGSQSLEDMRMHLQNSLHWHIRMLTQPE